VLVARQLPFNSLQPWVQFNTQRAPAYNATSLAFQTMITRPDTGQRTNASYYIDNQILLGSTRSPQVLGEVGASATTPAYATTDAFQVGATLKDRWGNPLRNTTVQIFLASGFGTNDPVQSATNQTDDVACAPCTASLAGQPDTYNATTLLAPDPLDYHYVLLTPGASPALD